MVDQLPASPLTALFIGEAGSDEFRAAFHWLRVHSELTVSRNMDDAEKLLTGARNHPVLLVLAQNYPGQFSLQAIEGLCRQTPLARLIHLVGAWCEGEIRSGQPAVGATRVYWHDWRPRLEAEWDRWRRGGCPTWGIAQAASDEERLAWQVQVAGDESKVVGVVTSCGETAQALAEMIDVTGFSPLVATGPAPVFPVSLSLVVWDEASAPRCHTAPLSQIVRDVAPTPVIALASFSRPSDVQNALENGAVEALAKPIHLADLSWLLHHHIPGAVTDVAIGTPAA